MNYRGPLESRAARTRSPRGQPRLSKFTPHLTRRYRAIVMLSLLTGAFGSGVETNLFSNYLKFWLPKEDLAENKFSRPDTVDGYDSLTKFASFWALPHIYYLSITTRTDDGYDFSSLDTSLFTIYTRQQMNFSDTVYKVREVYEDQFWGRVWSKLESWNTEGYELVPHHGTVSTLIDATRKNEEWFATIIPFMRDLIQEAQHLEALPVLNYTGAFSESVWVKPIMQRIAETEKREVAEIQAVFSKYDVDFPSVLSQLIAQFCVSTREELERGVHEYYGSMRDDIAVRVVQPPLKASAARLNLLDGLNTDPENLAFDTDTITGDARSPPDGRSSRLRALVPVVRTIDGRADGGSTRKGSFVVDKVMRDYTVMRDNTISEELFRVLFQGDKIKAWSDLGMAKMSKYRDRLCTALKEVDKRIIDWGSNRDVAAVKRLLSPFRKKAARAGARHSATFAAVINISKISQAFSHIRENNLGPFGKTEP